MSQRSLFFYLAFSLLAACSSGDDTTAKTPATHPLLEQTAALDKAKQVDQMAKEQDAAQRAAIEDQGK